MLPKSTDNRFPAPTSYPDKRGVVIGARGSYHENVVLKDATNVPAPTFKSAFMPMKYRKIGQIEMSVEKSMGNRPWRTVERNVKTQWIVNEHRLNERDKNGGACTVQIENKTGERRIKIEDVAGMQVDAFQRLMNLL
jgi:hypothetical protein